MPDIVCLRALISGGVQGVGFRYHTLIQAQTLGIGGWVCNLRNGCVEAMIEGERVQVDAMLVVLRQGPPAANVEGIEVNEQPIQGYSDFTIKRE